MPWLWQRELEAFPFSNGLSMTARKFLFTLFPGFSHLAPVVPVARRLRQSGHSVAFAVNDTLRDLIEEEGFQRFDAGAQGLSEELVYELEPEIRGLSGLDLNDRLWKKLFLPLAESMARDLLRIIPDYRPDVLFADATAYCAPIVQELTGVTWASYTPGVFLYESEDLPPIGPGFPPPRNQEQRQIYCHWRAAVRQARPPDALEKLDGWETGLNRIRNGLGLPAKERPQYDMSPNLIVSFVAESFDYPRSDLPPQVHFVGPSPWNRSTGDGLSPVLENLREDRPLIYVTLGTVFNGFRQAFDVYIDALKDLDASVIVTVGRFNDPAELGPLPDNFIVERFIPQHLILPKAALVICHAGFGTTMGALSAEVPMVCIPVAADNPEIAQRVHESGAGLRLDNVMAREKISDALTPERLKAATLEVLNNPSYRENARRLRLSFERYDGPGEAAALLAELARTRQPVYRKRAYWAGGNA